MNPIYNNPKILIYFINMKILFFSILSMIFIISWLIIN
jgi:hypothetical protein